MEPTVILSGLSEASGLNGAVGVRLGGSVKDRMASEARVASGGPEDEPGREGRVKVRLHATGRVVWAKKERVTETTSHVPGSVPLPRVGDMLRAASGEHVRKLMCFPGDVYLRDLTAKECYDKLSKWAKREGMSKAMWEIMPASPALLCEKIKMAIGPLGPPWAELNGGTGMCGASPLIIWTHSIAATLQSVEEFSTEFLTLVRSAGRLSSESARNIAQVNGNNPLDSPLFDKLNMSARARANALKRVKAQGGGQHPGIQRMEEGFHVKYQEGLTAILASTPEAGVAAVCWLPSCERQAQKGFDFAAVMQGRGEGAEQRLLQCSRCHDALYCSPEHQKDDWKRHKMTCRRAGKTAEKKTMKHAGKDEHENVASGAATAEGKDPSGPAASMAGERSTSVKVVGEGVKEGEMGGDGGKQSGEKKKKKKKKKKKGKG